jgi:hypothetical protein
LKPSRAKAPNATYRPHHHKITLGEIESAHYAKNNAKHNPHQPVKTVDHRHAANGPKKIFKQDVELAIKIKLRAFSSSFKFYTSVKVSRSVRGLSMSLSTPEPHVQKAV